MSRPSRVLRFRDAGGDYEVEVFDSPSPKGIVFTVHGFGTRRYDGGQLFGSIANELVDYTVILTDLNQISKQGTRQNPLRLQVSRLTRVIDDFSEKTHNSIVIAHSLGCAVASMTNAEVQLAIFLAPAVGQISPRLQTTFMNRSGTAIDKHGTMRAVRSDGSVTEITKEFWNHIKTIDTLSIYSEYVESRPTILLSAAEDELLKEENHKLQSVKFVRHIDIKNADHNFTGGTRKSLLDVINTILEKNDDQRLPKAN